MADKTENRLLEILGGLPPEQAAQLLEYAEFLFQRHAVPPEISERRVIPRPTEESVVRAIQRLRETYPMLDPTKLLNETSVLMSQHVMQGRDAVAVIDELEILFRRHYERVAGNEGK